MSEAYMELGSRRTITKKLSIPKLITLGGDHSIALPALRALRKTHGQPISVVHFDAHLDTWHPAKYPSAWIDAHETNPQSFFNHGSMFWLAQNEGLLANDSLIHAGLRTRLSDDGAGDNDDDEKQGWEQITADDIDVIGTAGIIERIMKRVGTEEPVYLSVDIDVLDPGLAPGTGTPEPGGWTTRELIRILRGIEGLNVVGADVVEVSPAYDGPGEATALAAAQVVYEILTSIVIRGQRSTEKERHRDEL
jgi:agmatinase